MFIGRKNELMKLNNMYQFDNFEFAVIYGRRRVGKSTLIQKFCEGKKFFSKDNKYFYLFAKNGTSDYVIEEANANPISIW